MRVAVFSAKPYDRRFLDAANHEAAHELVWFEPDLTAATAPLAQGFDAVCVFVNDQLHRATLSTLASLGVRIVALRCAGYNNVDIAAAQELGIAVARVPAYSPRAVAEHAVALMLALNRKLHKAYSRVREGNFSLDGLLGFDLCRRTVGVVGTGKIGQATAQILTGFGCRVLLYDKFPSEACQRYGEYVSLEALLSQADVVTLHCPLTDETRHLINAQAIQHMRPGVMLINTSRGGLVNTRAVIEGLKSGKIGYLGLDVYEEEAELFFEDRSQNVIHDDTFVRLLTFPNVLITGHQAFFTQEALEEISRVTIANLTAFERGEALKNAVVPTPPT